MTFALRVGYRLRSVSYLSEFFFFFNDTATTEIYTLSLHDALPISHEGEGIGRAGCAGHVRTARHARDRKSTRLNSSHLVISYAVFCLKKKKNMAADWFRTRTTIASAPVWSALHRRLLLLPAFLNSF